MTREIIIPVRPQVSERTTKRWLAVRIEDDCFDFLTELSEKTHVSMTAVASAIIRDAKKYVRAAEPPKLVLDDGEEAAP